jgi:hypothetical protein
MKRMSLLYAKRPSSWEDAPADWWLDDDDPATEDEAEDEAAREFRAAGIEPTCQEMADRVQELLLADRAMRNEGDDDGD